LRTCSVVGSNKSDTSQIQGSKVKYTDTSNIKKRVVARPNTHSQSMQSGAECKTRLVARSNTQTQAHPTHTAGNTAEYTHTACAEWNMLENTSGSQVKYPDTGRTHSHGWKQGRRFDELMYHLSLSLKNCFTTPKSSCAPMTASPARLCADRPDSSMFTND